MDKVPPDSMNALDVRKRYRENRYTAADINSVRRALEQCDASFLSNVVATYIKYSKNLDERALVHYLTVAQDSWPVHEIISGLSILRCKARGFTAEVLRYAEGVSWDTEDYARIAAISAIPRVLQSDSRVQAILQSAVKSDNIVVRDCAFEAAQEFLGIPPANIVRGRSDNEDLAHQVRQEVRDWLEI